MSEKAKSVIVVLEPSAKSATELLAMVEEKNLADVVRVPSVEEALQTIAQSLPCIFMASINENAEVPTRVQLFKRLEGAIKQQGLKVFVVTPIKNRQLSDMVTQKLGVADYIVEPIPARTMQFKLNLQLKALDNFRRQQELKKAAAEAVVIKKLENNKKADGPAGGEVKTNGKPAVQAGEDTFLFKNSGVKKAGKKYTVELEGPAPETGEWVPHEDKGDPTPAWRWVPNEEKEAQAKGEIPPDGWVHKGDKPQFNDESQKWAMTSEKPSLSLRQKGVTTAEKMGTDESGEVFMAEDSAAAEENLAKNRAKAALLRPKKEKTALKALLKAGEEEPAAPHSQKDSPDTVEKDKGARSKARAKDDKLSALKNLLAGGDEEEETASAGDLVDKRSGDTSEGAPELQDKRGEEQAPTSFKGLKEGAQAPAAKKDPLAFLKMKQEELKRAEMARLKGDPLPEGVNPLEESDDEDPAAPSERALKRKKKAKSPLDALARLKQSLAEDAPEEESENELSAGTETAEDEGGDSARPALRIAKNKAERNGAEALREDPAGERGELHDRQGGRAKEKLRSERKRAVADMQALLEEPLPETLPPEEEEALRAEFGLKGRPEISAKDLARKKRLKNAKALKDRLAELELELSEEEAGEAVSGAISREDPATAPRNLGDLSKDKLTGIRGAFDNEETEEELEAERKRIKAKHEAERKKAANRDKAIYVPEAEIQPTGNAWESAGTHYVYLASTVRYKGFGKLDELLPLWFFEGDDVPQLLDKTKQWRFLGRRPEQARTVAEIPVPVRDFLIGLRDQLNKGEDGDTREKEAATGSLDVDSKDRKKKSDSKMDSLRARLGDDDETEAGEEHTENDGSGTEKETRESAESEDPTAEKSSDRGESAEDSKFDRLKALLGDDDEEAENNAPGSAGEERSGTKSGADAMERLRAKLGMDEEEEPKDSYSAKLAELPGQSEAVKKFLEKRKKKGVEPTALNELSVKRAPAPSFLGVFVALSDAYSHQANPDLALTRVLGSMQDSFKDCIVYCTDVPDATGMAEVRYRGTQVPDPAEKIALASGLSEPVQRTAGGAPEVLGYLYIAALGERTAFSEAEELTFRSMAAKLWPLLSLALATGSKDAA